MPLIILWVLAGSACGPRATSQPVSAEAPAAVPQKTEAPTGPGASDIVRARTLLAHKRWTDAVAAADAAIAAGADSSEAYLLKGVAHRGLDEYEAAEGALLEAARRDRTSPEPLYLLAEMAERQGARGRCEELYRRILDEIDPRFMPAREQLVRLYLNNNQIDAASECFAGFAKYGQTGPVVDRCQAYLTFKTGRGENRLKDYQAELERIIAQHPKDVRSRTDLAILFFAGQEYRASSDEVDRILALDPEDLRVRELKVLTESRLLHFDGAERVLRGLLADRPRNAGYQRQLLELDLDRADFDGAVKLLRELLDRKDLQDRRDQLTAQLVDVLRLAGRYDEALDVVGKWREAAPKDPLRRATWLSVLSRAGRFDEAVAGADEWLAEDPKNVDLRLQALGELGLAHRYVEAEQRLLSWLEEDPDNLTLNGELIRLCWLTKQWDGAVELASIGREDVQHQGEYEQWLCRSYVLAGRFDDAIAFYRDRIELLDSLRRKARSGEDPSTLRLYHEAIKDLSGNLLATLTAAQRFAEAEELANRLLGEQIEQRTAGGVEYDAAWLQTLRRMLSNICQLTDRPVQAAQQLEEIYAATPKDPGINNDLGYIWADAGIRLDDAERMTRFAVGEKPREYAYLDSLAWVLYKRGAMSDAIRYLHMAVRQGGKDAVIYDHLGDALYRQGETEEAVLQWRKALELSEPAPGETQTPEDRRLRQRAQAKLDRLAAGEPAEVAPLAPAEP